MQLLEARVAAAEDRAQEAQMEAAKAAGRAEIVAFEHATLSRELRRALASVAELWREIARTTR